MSIEQATRVSSRHPRDANPGPDPSAGTAGTRHKWMQTARFDLGCSAAELEFMDALRAYGAGGLRKVLSHGEAIELIRPKRRGRAGGGPTP